MLIQTCIAFLRFTIIVAITTPFFISLIHISHTHLTHQHHPPAASPEDPFATTEGSADIAPELDLFAMRPTNTGSITPPISSEAPTIDTPIAAPTPSSNTTTTPADTTTTESAAPPTLDIFGGKVLSLCLSIHCPALWWWRSFWWWMKMMLS